MHFKRSLPTFLYLFLVVLFPVIYPGGEVWGFPNAFGSDSQGFHLPHQQWVYDTLVTGRIPFWNPYVFGGGPEFGNPEMAPLYPFSVLPLLLFGPLGMLHLKFILHLVLLGVGTFLFLRDLHFKRFWALLGAWTIMLSGVTITKIGLPNVADSAAWLPLMLCLNQRFARRPDWRRGLVYGVAGGLMLLLFYPQITLTIVLFLAFAGGMRFLRFTAARRAGGWSRFFQYGCLPVLELIVLLLLLRYPPHPVRFPEPGWRCAFQGFGITGFVLLVITAAAWLVWMLVARFRVCVALRPMGRWMLRFAGVWCLAAILAAPQLAVTGEFIRFSNQARLVYSSDEDFFTGAQAYGSTREFIQASALASPKELVNNMALGPVIWGLLAIGIALGCHRRRRVAFYALFFAAGIFAVYMAAPGVFDVFRRLPFFSKFAGISRYLGFLNFFLILFAFLAVAEILRRVPRRGKKWVAFFIALLVLGNLGLLLRHEAGFFRYLKKAGASDSIPADVPRMLQQGLLPGERMLVDVRNDEDSIPLFMMALRYRIPSIGGYSPMRSGAYNDWLHAHNQFLGVSHDDYHFAYFEPVPTVWTRALGVRWFAFPPGAQPEKKQWDVAAPGYVAQNVDQWTLVEDKNIAPPAWPEKSLDVTTPTLSVPAGWIASVALDEVNRMWVAICNPSAETWGVFSLPAYPGWEAWCDGRQLETSKAYGFLFAAKIPAGKSIVELRYRPKSFIAGWLIFIAGVWICWGVARQIWRGGFVPALWCVWTLVGVALCALIGMFVWNMVDYLVFRVCEFLGVCMVGALFLWLPQTKHD